LLSTGQRFRRDNYFIGGALPIVLIDPLQGIGWPVPEPHVSKPHVHATHPDIVKRLRRAEGRLRGIVEVVEGGRYCLDTTQPSTTVAETSEFSHTAARHRQRVGAWSALLHRSSDGAA